MAAIADLVVNFVANIADFRASMEEAGKSVATFQDTIKTAAKAVGEFFALREVVRFAEEAASATIEWSRSVEELAQRMGTTTEAASALAVSAREHGVEVSTVEQFTQALTRTLTTHEDRFRTLGIAVRDTSGQYLSLEQIQQNTLNRLAQFEEGTNRNTAAQYLLQRAAGSVVGELGRLRETLDPSSMQHATEVAQAFGLVVENGAQKAKEWELALGDLHFAMRSSRWRSPASSKPGPIASSAIST